MGASSKHEVVSCKTIDGTDISGLLYTVEGPASAIIMSHGFNCIKEMTLPEVAEALQADGYNVLIYDARSVGASGSEPRNLLDPLLMAEDLSDICTYVADLPTVDPRRIILWGMSFGAVVSACCAAVDRRARAVVMVCPLFSYAQPHKVDKLCAQLVRDRVSQLRGNEPYVLAPFTSRGDNPIGMGGAGGPGGLEAYNLMNSATRLGLPSFRDRISFQTYQKLAMFRPMAYMDMIKAPLMMIIPTLDTISPPEEQREAFSRVLSPKREYMADGKGHLDMTTGEGSKEIYAATIKFIEDALEGTV